MAHSASSPLAAFSPQPAELIASGLLSASLESDVALIHVKDRAGRYLRVNRRLAECLGTSAERLIGQLDEQLPAGETIDGPRIQAGTGVSAEPQTLEYVVDAFGTRPALLVLRFTVVDGAGAVAGTCAVAAAHCDAAPARTEGERLLAIAGLLPEPARSAASVVDEPAERPEPVGAGRNEHGEMLRAEAELQALRAELAQTRTELMQTRAELEIARRGLHARELVPAVAAPEAGVRPAARGSAQSRWAFGRS